MNPLHYYCLLSLLWASSLSALAADEKVNLNLGKGNGIYHHGCFDRRRVNLMPDLGWYSFFFDLGNSGRYAMQTFYFNLPLPSRLVLTDCYCGGDSFVAYESYDSYNRIIDASYEGCQGANEACNYYNTDPNFCVGNVGWCSGYSDIIYPGFHNITIMIAKSPFRAGTGFIRLQTMCDDPDLGWVPCCSLDNTCNDQIYQKTLIAKQQLEGKK